MIFGAFQVTKIAAAFAMARFGKPALVRETSKLGVNQLFTLPFHLAKKAIHRSVKKRSGDLFDGVILNEELEEQLKVISNAVLNK
jgi:hypothetical protein